MLTYCEPERESDLRERRLVHEKSRERRAMFYRRFPEHEGNSENILLINPPVQDFRYWDTWVQPVGLLSIAAVLREHNYSISLIDCLKVNKKTRIDKPEAIKEQKRNFYHFGLTFNEIEEEVRKVQQPRAVLITSFMTYWYPALYGVIRICKQVFPGIPVVVGGIHATLQPYHVLERSAADYIVQGEGEITALQIVSTIVRGEYARISEIDGIGYKSANQTIAVSPKRLWIQNLSALPLPAYDLLAMSNFAAMVTSRGCPNRCSYCGVGLLAGNKVRRVSADSIKKSIRGIVTGLKRSNIALYDDNLLAQGREHLEAIKQMKIQLGNRVRFHIPSGIQASKVDSEVAALIRETGVKTIRLALESADTQVLKRMNREAISNPEVLAKAITNLEQAGYKRKEIGVFLIMGLPYQSVISIIRTVILLGQLGVMAIPEEFTPIPGTADFDECVNTQLIDLNTDLVALNGKTFSGSNHYLTREDASQIRNLCFCQNIAIMHDFNPLENLIKKTDLEAVFQVLRELLMNKKSILLSKLEREGDSVFSWEKLKHKLSWHDEKLLYLFSVIFGKRQHSITRDYSRNQLLAVPKKKSNAVVQDYATLAQSYKVR